MIWDQDLIADLDRPRGWSRARIRAESEWIWVTRPEIDVYYVKRRPLPKAPVRRTA